MTYKENIERDYDMLKTCHKVLFEENKTLKKKINLLKTENEHLKYDKLMCEHDKLMCEIDEDPYHPLWHVEREIERDKSIGPWFPIGFIVGAAVMGMSIAIVACAGGNL